jgi:hypothetical protein
VQNVDRRIGRREFVSDLAGAVRAAVIDDENVSGRNGCPEPADDRLQVVALVIGRDDDGNLT